MIVMDWIKKLTDIIMPLEPPGEDEDEVKEPKKSKPKPRNPSPRKHPLNRKLSRRRKKLPAASLQISPAE